MWSFCFLNDSKFCSDLFIRFHLPRDTCLWLMQLLRERMIDPMFNFGIRIEKRGRAVKEAERTHCDNPGWLLHFFIHWCNFCLLHNNFELDISLVQNKLFILFLRIPGSNCSSSLLTNRILYKSIQDIFFCYVTIHHHALYV